MYGCVGVGVCVCMYVGRQATLFVSSIATWSGDVRVYVCMSLRS